jgi:hypothetical protein
MLALPDHLSLAKLREAPNTRDAKSSVPEHHASFAFPQSCPSEASFPRDGLARLLGREIAFVAELMSYMKAGRDTRPVFSACIKFIGLIA